MSYAKQPRKAAPYLCYPLPPCKHLVLWPCTLCCLSPVSGEQAAESLIKRSVRAGVLPDPVSRPEWHDNPGKARTAVPPGSLLSAVPPARFGTPCARSPSRTQSPDVYVVPAQRRVLGGSAPSSHPWGTPGDVSYPPSAGTGTSRPHAQPLLLLRLPAAPRHVKSQRPRSLCAGSVGKGLWSVGAFLPPGGLVTLLIRVVHPQFRRLFLRFCRRFLFS